MAQSALTFGATPSPEKMKTLPAPRVKLRKLKKKVEPPPHEAKSRPLPLTAGLEPAPLASFHYNYDPGLLEFQSTQCLYAPPSRAITGEPEVPPRSQEDNPTGQRECAVCTETLPVTEFPASTVTSSCAHSVRTCKRCIADSIHAELERKQWTDVACPECDTALSFEDVKEYAAQLDFER